MKLKDKKNKMMMMCTGLDEEDMKSAQFESSSCSMYPCNVSSVSYVYQCVFNVFLFFFVAFLKVLAKSHSSSQNPRIFSFLVEKNYHKKCSQIVSCRRLPGKE